MGEDDEILRLERQLDEARRELAALERRRGPAAVAVGGGPPVPAARDTGYRGPDRLLALRRAHEWTVHRVVDLRLEIADARRSAHATTVKRRQGGLRSVVAVAAGAGGVGALMTGRLVLVLGVVAIAAAIGGVAMLVVRRWTARRHADPLP